jgi:hypothetical protein
LFIFTGAVKELEKNDLDSAFDSFERQAFCDHFSGIPFLLNMIPTTLSPFSLPFDLVSFDCILLLTPCTPTLLLHLLTFPSPSIRASTPNTVKPPKSVYLDERSEGVVMVIAEDAGRKCVEETKPGWKEGEV